MRGNNSYLSIDRLFQVRNELEKSVDVPFFFPCVLDKFGEQQPVFFFLNCINLKTLKHTSYPKLASLIQTQN